MGSRREAISKKDVRGGWSGFRVLNLRLKIYRFFFGTYPVCWVGRFLKKLFAYLSFLLNLRGMAAAKTFSPGARHQRTRSTPMHALKLYLTVDADGTTKLWEHTPHYFRIPGGWERPSPAAMRFAEFLQARFHLFVLHWLYEPLPKIALALGIKPGPKGIMEVTLEIKPAK